ncbi:flagellar biosynthesis GTPase FlhF [Clostridium acetobutylicum]|nr:flagellar biosynthesis GTPase FlhF [Clostridium acetobutylicum]
MNLPFKVVLTLKEMDEAIKSMQNCDIILVDTTGRSSKNKMQISELRAFVSKTNSLNINLVISATTKNRDLEAIIDGYRQLDFQNVIITKLDETTTYGSIINILNYAHKPFKLCYYRTECS